MSKGTRTKQNLKTAGLLLLTEYKKFKDRLDEETETQTDEETAEILFKIEQNTKLYITKEFSPKYYMAIFSDEVRTKILKNNIELPTLLKELVIKFRKGEYALETSFLEVLKSTSTDQKLRSNSEQKEFAIEMFVSNKRFIIMPRNQREKRPEFDEDQTKANNDSVINAVKYSLSYLVMLALEGRFNLDLSFLGYAYSLDDGGNKTQFIDDFYYDKKILIFDKDFNSEFELYANLVKSVLDDKEFSVSNEIEIEKQITETDFKDFITDLKAECQKHKKTYAGTGGYRFTKSEMLSILKKRNSNGIKFLNKIIDTIENRKNVILQESFLFKVSPETSASNYGLRTKNQQPHSGIQLHKPMIFSLSEFSENAKPIEKLTKKLASAINRPSKSGIKVNKLYSKHYTEGWKEQPLADITSAIIITLLTKGNYQSSVLDKSAVKDCILKPNKYDTFTNLFEMYREYRDEIKSKHGDEQGELELQNQVSRVCEILNELVDDDKILKQKPFADHIKKTYTNPNLKNISWIVSGQYKNSEDAFYWADIILCASRIYNPNAKENPKSLKQNIDNLLTGCEKREKDRTEFLNFWNKIFAGYCRNKDNFEDLNNHLTEQPDKDLLEVILDKGMAAGATNLGGIKILLGYIMYKQDYLNSIDKQNKRNQNEELANRFNRIHKKDQVYKIVDGKIELMDTEMYKSLHNKSHINPLKTTASYSATQAPKDQYIFPESISMNQHDQPTKENLKDPIMVYVQNRRSTGLLFSTNATKHIVMANTTEETELCDFLESMFQFDASKLSEDKKEELFDKLYKKYDNVKHLYVHTNSYAFKYKNISDTKHGNMYELIDSVWDLVETLKEVEQHDKKH